jgi:dihydrofolate reductase
MGKLRVNAFSVSLDGFGAGPDQDLQNPMGVGAMSLHQWVFPTRSFKAMHGGGGDGGETGIDNDFSLVAMENLGAWILGRNMFGPVRGPWPNDDWKGWWGPNPPYHVPVFVLTHYPRASLEMEGGNVFHFVTGGIEEALARAKRAAGDKDVRVGGGVATVRAYLSAGHIDEMHVALAPAMLGKGENLFAGLDLPALGYQVSAVKAGERATHYTIAKKA